MNLSLKDLRLEKFFEQTRVERKRQATELAKELEEEGNYADARAVLKDLWPLELQRPELEGLNEREQAELLLRAGTITSWLAHINPTADGQDRAKDLLSESDRRFNAVADAVKSSEARTNLALCYWREGSFDNARITIRQALDLLKTTSSPEAINQKANTLISAAIIELSATRFHDALQLMEQAAPLIAKTDKNILVGKFHANRGIILKNLSEGESQELYSDRAYEDFLAAIHYFKLAGHTRYQANTENNLGFLLLTLNRLSEAEEHLKKARSLYDRLKDQITSAQVADTYARVLTAQKRLTEASQTITASIRTLEKSDRLALLAEALTTQGIIKARLQQPENARASFTRAIETAKMTGATEQAGLAALCMLEELQSTMETSEAATLYSESHALLSTSLTKQLKFRLLSVSTNIIDSITAQQPRPKEPRQRSEFIHAEPATDRLLEIAKHSARYDHPVLITGETGVGKDLLARLIHRWSKRRGQIVPVNCAALPEGLIESQIFGHRKGSFTGAVADQPGAVRAAEGGTLFLDEIGDIGLGNQAKLLRLIENNEIHPVGAPIPEKVDVRIVAATNHNIQELVTKGRFREDLYYRLKTFHLEIPPLRQRPNDIVALAHHFIEETNRRFNKHVRFTDDALQAMSTLPLYGNTRELKSLIERTILLSDGKEEIITGMAIEIIALRLTELSTAHFADASWKSFNFSAEMVQHENKIIELALKQTDGKIGDAAKLLGMTRQKLAKRLKTRNKGAATARLPAQTRQRSIIAKTGT